MPQEEAGSAVKFRHKLEYALLVLGRWFFRVIPRAAALWFARFLGIAGYYLFPRRRRVMLKNLGIAFPDMEKGERRKIARRFCASFAASIVDSFRTDEIDAEPSRFFEYEDADVKRLQKLLDAGKGVVIAFFHYGNWELFPSVWCALGLTPISLIARHIRNPLVTDLLTKTRTKDNVRLLFKGSAGREVLRTIKRGGSIGIVCDLNTSVSDGIFVDFFGVPAATTPAPAELSLRYGAPVVIAFVERKRSGGYYVRFDPVIKPEDFKNEAEPVPAMTLAINRASEEVIRRDPGQYLWGHRRWSTRPPGDPWELHY